MADIELVIKMPENTYRRIQALARDGYFEHDICGNSMRRIANGIPLPKGHGRLIDADEYKEHLYACETNGRPLHIMELDERLATVDDAPTIIEADKESE